MGQAKIRSEEIKALKSKSASNCKSVGDRIKLIAVKHRRGGGRDIAILDNFVTNFSKSKDQLLKDICTQEWEGVGRFENIINYFSLTSNYQIYKMMGMHGFIVNFYECDDDYGGAYSCRQIIAIIDKDSFNDAIKSL